MITKRIRHAVTLSGALIVLLAGAQLLQAPEQVKVNLAVAIAAPHLACPTPREIPLCPQFPCAVMTPTA